MTQDQIIQTLHKVVAENQNFTTWTVSTPHLVGLVNHAIEAEREACAKVVLTIANKDAGNPYKQALRIGAEAIRARGQQ
jgi:hypothetical protein